MNKKRIARAITGMLLVFMLGGTANAKEPTLPDVNKTLSPRKEARISRWDKLSVEQCFEQLKGSAFILDQDFSNKAIDKCFKNKKAEMVEYAINILKLPSYTVDGERTVLELDHHVAKSALQVFAPQAESILVKLYSEANAEKRANIVYVMGQMTGKKSRKLLIDALDDRAVYEEIYPDMEGKPLRVCDMAYNQLRLRYAEELVDLPRTIANFHRINIRDSYIDAIYDRL